MNKRAHLVTFLAALLACLVVVFWMVGPFLMALFLGGTLAMLAHPAYLLLRAESWGDRTAAAVVTALMLVLVVAPLTGLATVAVRQGVAVGREMAESNEFSPRAVTAELVRWRLVRTFVGDPEAVDGRLQSAVRVFGQWMSSAVLTLGEGVPEFILQQLLAVISFYFFLVDGERFVEWLLGLGIFDREMQERLVEAFRGTATSAVQAGLASSATLAALITAGFLLLGVPGAFLAGGLTFIFAWIPLLGAVPAALAGVLYLDARGSSIKMALMIALGAAAIVVGNLIPPLVLKGRAGMHPLAGFVAVIGGIRMFGMLGVFIGPILVAMLQSLLRTWPVIAGRAGLDSTSGL
jgi:predicted PurR-regulated permease PerM